MRVVLDKNLLRSLLTLGSVVEARDVYTAGHTWRVGQYARLLAEKAGLAASEVFVVTLGAHLHDLGKIGVSDAILLKPAALTDEEFEAMRAHPETGRRVIFDHPLAPLLLDAVAHHHERYDGRGYPYGIDGAQLSIQTRVVSIADAFDAMTSTRPYRKGMPMAKALAILESEKEKQFDPALVNFFIELEVTGALAHVLGHSDFERPMLECPVCGPVIAAPRSTVDGAQIHCRVCKGKFRLHASQTTFEAEFLNEFASLLPPEPEADPIEDVVRQAPKDVVVAG